MDSKTLRPFFHLSRPLLLLDAVLAYALGLGIAHYLGAALDWGISALGLVWVLTLQLGWNYLHVYFILHNPLHLRRHTAPSEEHVLGEQDLPPELYLWTGIAALTVATSLTLMLIRIGGVGGAVYLSMGLLVAGAFVYTVPPFRLASSVYRELILSVMLANFIPALAFLLQESELHRLISMSTFPLTLLHLAMLLTFQIPNFGTDLKYERPTLLVRLGWQRGMRLINILNLLGFLLLGIAMLIGFPGYIAMPAFFALPLGLFQIWYLTRIAAGAKPHWTMLRWLAVSVFGLTTYLLTFSFWTR
ncbi:MAG: hypothetical protein U9Q82_12025 [Chloroflexota bacterium]|nr:hypothetical protein [Chloroflexota bacterium]